jgi:hypothetical protein
MCIIYAVPEDVVRVHGKVSRKLLEEAWAINPDGAGIAWADGKEVHWRKGFMRLKDFVEFYYEGTPSPIGSHVMHFRLASAGGDDQSFTHPFPVSTEFRDLYKLSGSTTKAVLFHNGTVPDFGTPGVMSDSQEIALLIANKKKTGLAAAIAPGRLAILEPSGQISYVGEWVSSSTGIMASNKGGSPAELSWKVRVRRWVAANILRNPRWSDSNLVAATHMLDHQKLCVRLVKGGGSVPLRNITRDSAVPVLVDIETWDVLVDVRPEGGLYKMGRLERYLVPGPKENGNTRGKKRKE